MSKPTAAKKKVYFISGLGADRRAFSLLDLSFCEPVFVDWIVPEPHEPLAHYALRLKDQITEPAPVIVGLSFGGMLASEIALADPSARVVIISSNKTKSEFPRGLLIGKYLPLYKWVPAPLLKKRPLLSSIFLSPHGKTQKELFNAIARDSDYSFTKWAIEAILNWKNSRVPVNLQHIHGTADRLLPYRRVKADFTVKGGTHLMIMNNPAELSSILREIIAGL